MWFIKLDSNNVVIEKSCNMQDGYVEVNGDVVCGQIMQADGSFINPIIPTVIPQTITPRQARLKLLEVGLLDELEVVITTNRAWQIEWEYATEVKRDSPLIEAIATQSGLTEEQIDQMFKEASVL